MWNARSPHRALAAICVVAGAAGFLAVALPAEAHGFGQRYDLPLPLSLYLWATAAAVVLSFVVAGLFVRQTPRDRSYRRLNLLAYPIGRIIASPLLAFVLKLLAVVLFVVTVVAGFIGNADPYRNIAPTLVWVVAWVGLAYVSAFIADVWALLNPWRNLFAAAQWTYGRLSGGRMLSLGVAYPERLGVWPAFALLLTWSWVELVYPSPALPIHIAWFAVGYSLLTWVGMAVFGCETWLRRGEVFTVVFGVFARFAPTEAQFGGQRRELVLRPFASGLGDSHPVSPSMTALVLLILATVLYDGVLATPEWNGLEDLVVAWMPDSGDAAVLAIRTLGLVVAWTLFFGAYLAVCAVMSALAGQSTTWTLARSFALTLVPIAIAYHLAHYLVYLLVQGQYIIPLLSDPFGYGWNLFGTVGYRVNIGIVGARFAWYTAVTAIVLGHVIAVFLAHTRAMGLFETRRVALRSQIPLTALMVAYTFVSLSILAEPITERSAPAEPASETTAGVRIPPDAVLPEGGSGRLLAVGPDRIAKQKLTYRLLGSAFHDGTKTEAADLLYAYAFAYRWGVRNDADQTHFDPVIESATAPLREHLAGVKVVGTDTVSKSFRVGDINVVRELFVIDVYTATAGDDPEQDAAIAPPWSTVPWHVLVLMEEAVSRGWAAFSQSEASRHGVEWLDIVRSERIKERLASLVDSYARDGYRPDVLRSMVSAEEARKRWAALATFYREHGHFLVTNGPYQLKQWSADSVELEVFRDLSYPLGVGSYDAYAIPRRAFITKVEREKDGLRIFGDIETIMKFQRSYEIHRDPLQSVDADVVQRAAPECRYTVVDEAGRVALAGTVQRSDDATFRLPVPGDLPAGRYTVFAAIVVDANAMNADIQRIPLVVSAGP
jgi:hypothetical protein